MKHFFLSLALLAFAIVSFGQHTIKVEVKTDNYGSETSWKVIDIITNTVIGSGGPYTNVSGGQVKTAQFDVSGDGCYWFYIYDSYGDGICCSYGQGYYKVWYDEVLIGQGAQFQAVATISGMGTGCVDNEITLKELNINDYAIFDENVNISGKVTNFGALNLTNFKVTYKVGDGDWVEEYTKTCNVATGQDISFTHNIPVSFNTEGSYDITVKVSMPNGEVDNEDDNVLTKTIFVNAASTPRRVLLEHFTTAQCSNCPAATANLKNWLTTRPDVIWISHHAGYYTDNYTIPLNQNLLVFFNDGGSTYAPAIMLDRRFLAPDGDPGPVFFPLASYTPGLIDACRNTPAFVTVNMDGLYNPTTRQLTLTVSGEFVGTVDGSPRISVYIAENNLVGNQAGATSNYNHSHVVRGAISGNWGDANIITSSNTGSTYSKTYDYTVSANWKFEDLYIVAFINDYHTSVNDREVFNANMMYLSDFVSVNTQNLENLKIYPNPVENILNIANAEGADIQILNVTGQLVYSINNASSIESIGLENIQSGTYIVRIVKDNKIRTEKIVVTK